MKLWSFWKNPRIKQALRIKITELGGTLGRQWGPCVDLHAEGQLDYLPLALDGKTVSPKDLKMRGMKVSLTF